VGFIGKGGSLLRWFTWQARAGVLGKSILKQFEIIDVRIYPVNNRIVLGVSSRGPRNAC
jgi:hypothetical protein